MKIFHIFLISHFIIFQTVRADLTAIPESLVIHVPSERGETIPVNLLRVESFLANENVPVWVLNPENPTKLASKIDVMKELSPFTMYWDRANCAAAVYHHKRSEFNAIIGHHRVIRKLYYNPTTKSIEKTKDTELFSTVRQHDENRLLEDIDLIVQEDDDVHGRRVQSRMEYPEEVYIETLVIVNYDITEKLNFDYAEVVSYVLTTFNMVDMLYSKIEVPRIRINIAGIIIATARNSFSKSLLDCYHQRSSYREFRMDADCSLDAIYRVLKHYKNLSFQSYDVAVFITRHDLFRWSIEIPGTPKTRMGKKIRLWGLTDASRVSVGYKLLSRGIGISIAGNPDIYSIFPTIAHEMAHLFDVPHDGGSLWKEDGTCDAHLLKNDDSYCNKCLQFGGTTPEHLKNFFGTRQGCIFRNKPTSLINPQGRQLFWTEDEQCVCYGYLGVYTSTNRFTIREIFLYGVDCQSRLECVSRNNRKRRTGVYMNGTPCDREKVGSKVCWNSKCSPVAKDSQLVPDN